MKTLYCAEMRKAPAVAEALWRGKPAVAEGLWRGKPAVTEGLWRGKSAVAGKAQVECILPQRAQRTHGTEGLDCSLWPLGSMWLKTPEKFFGFLEKFSHFNVKFRKVFGYFFLGEKALVGANPVKNALCCAKRERQGNVGQGNNTEEFGRPRLRPLVTTGQKAGRTGIRRIQPL